MPSINCAEDIECVSCGEEIEDQVAAYINDPNCGGLPFKCCECGSLLLLDMSGIIWKTYPAKSFNPDDCDGSCGSICDGSCHDLESGYFEQ